MKGQLLFFCLLLLGCKAIGQNSYEFAYHMDGPNFGRHLAVGDSNALVLIPQFMFYRGSYDVYKREVIHPYIGDPVLFSSYFSDGSDFAMQDFFDYDYWLKGFGYGSIDGNVFHDDIFICDFENECIEKVGNKAIVYFENGKYLVVYDDEVVLIDMTMGKVIKSFDLVNGEIMKNKNGIIHFLNDKDLYHFDKTNLEFEPMTYNTSQMVNLSKVSNAIYQAKNDNYYFHKTDAEISEIVLFNISNQTIEPLKIVLPQKAMDAVVEDSFVYWLPTEQRRIHRFNYVTKTDQIIYEDYHPDLKYTKLYRKNNSTFALALISINSNQDAISVIQQHQDDNFFRPERNDLRLSIEKISSEIVDTLSGSITTYGVRVIAKATVTNHGSGIASQYNIITSHPFLGFFENNIFSTPLNPGESKEFNISVEAYTSINAKLHFQYRLLGADYLVDTDYSDNIGSLDISLSTKDEIMYDVLVMPSPVQDEITIHSSTVFDIYKIYNSIGQMQNTSIHNTFDVSALQAGIYYISCENEKGIVTKAFVKQ